MTFPLFIRFLLVLITGDAVIPFSNADVLPGVSALSDSLVRESAIAFFNTTASPGLEGAALTVDDGFERWYLRSDVGCAVRTIKQESGMLVRAFGLHSAPYNCYTIVKIPSPYLSPGSREQACEHEDQPEL